MSQASSPLLSKGDNGYLSSNPRGDVAQPHRGEALYWEDTRHLSEYVLSARPYRFALIGVEQPEPHRARIELTVDRPLGPTTRVIRDRMMAPHLLETLRVQNPEDLQSSLALRLVFRADFADTSEGRGRVRPRGRAPPAELSGRSVLLSRSGTEGTRRWTRLTFEPLPNRLNRKRVVWDLYLPPQSETVLTAQVESGRGQPPVGSRA